jgi:signal transduction histidine kinase
MADPVTDYAGPVDLTPAVQALTKSKTQILDRWLDRVTKEPFHLGRRERAISDHIPALFEALVQSLSGDAPAHRAVHSTIETEEVKEAAGLHARARRSQGLSVTEVISEIRMLRQETSRALMESLAEDELISGILAAELALNDGFDGAICIAADAVVAGIEQEHREALAITAHDLKTPLAAVKGAAQLALRRSQAPHAEIDEMLNRIVDGSNRVRDIVDEAVAAIQAADGDQLRTRRLALIRSCKTRSRRWAWRLGCASRYG